ncbi:ATP-binding protein [Paucibacter sp. DJ2R-2]|uniref:ATP-binding protein n=1 Tax=Paucibacter sp. DJ2R-2 TaxID=2893558 RepID=UPI0021E4694C|nr:ATP-binding protein [Paucibacter sp. DJ2R-2]MCV2420207.1 HAMP domain-containing protein [Paucibacter sp. DJ4R-1]MCV2436848.1 HAMP domain-containing protein [Paucibacter sp. DJ2R-2]
MRLRLVHSLSLLLLAVVSLTVLGMGGVMAWNLSRGFNDYLQAREVDRLERLAELTSDLLQQDGAGLDGFLRSRVTLRGLLDELARREGLNPGGRALPMQPGLPPALAGEPPPPPWRRLREREGPPPPPPPAEDGFGGRVGLYSLQGELLLGRPQAEGRRGARPPWALERGPGDRMVERAVYGPAAGAERVPVAWLRLRLPKPLPDSVDALFLRRQYQGIAVVAVLMLGLALLGAWWLTRRWSQALLAVQDATARIAQGELSVRLPDPGRSDEIGDVLRNINRMAAGLQALEGTRRRWIADISHELRTPLSVLRGEIEALIDGVRPLSTTALQSLREEVLQLASLVDDLHLLAMADLGALPCRRVDSDAQVLLQRLLQRYAPRAAAAGLDLQPGKTWPSGPVPVFWDPVRIEQLLGNLLENSLRYTDAPGRIVLDLSLQGEQLLLTVDDSAPGVAAADVGRLFEPLYRADAARSRHLGGSGLGLAICAAIAQAHGGRLSAGASSLGGLQVTLSLPRRAPQEHP